MTKERREMLVDALVLSVGLPIAVCLIYWVGDRLIEHLVTAGIVLMLIPAGIVGLAWLASRK